MSIAPNIQYFDRITGINMIIHTARIVKKDHADAA